MLHPVKSFDEFSLKVVAVRAADNSDFEFEFPFSSAGLPPALPDPVLEKPANRLRDPLGATDEWHHGGINE